MKPISIPKQILIWLLLFVFWAVFSLDYHPTLAIDIIVTMLLVLAYSSAIYVNHLVLIPRLFRSRRYFQYSVALLVAMALLTFVVLFAIRLTYTRLWDPNELGNYWQHYAIDLFGMAVHVLAAAIVVWIASRLANKRHSLTDRA